MGMPRRERRQHREARDAEKRAWKRSERNALRVQIADYLASGESVEGLEYGGTSSFGRPHLR